MQAGGRGAWIVGQRMQRYGGVRQALTFAAFRSAGAALGGAPQSVADVGAFLVSQVLAARRPAAAQLYVGHVARVLGRPVGRAEGRQWVSDVFANYARYWQEGARLPTVAGPAIDQAMVVERGYDHLVSAMEAGRGAIVALPHLGGWEWGGAWLARQGHPMTAVAEVLQPPALYEWFVAQRAAMGIHVLPLGSGSTGELVRVLRHGGLVGLVSDRDLTGAGVPVQFFGEATTLPAGPATLAIRTGAALLPTAVYLGPGPMHHAVIEAPVEHQRTGSLRADVARMTQDLAGSFEGLIRRAPDQWYSFQPMWPGEQLGETGHRADGSAGSHRTAPAGNADEREHRRVS